LPKQERNFDKPVLNLLFVGRFAFNKGINILMDAVKQLNNEGYKERLFFYLVGKGPLFDKYVQEYDFPNVKFVGFADEKELAALYDKTDLFVFPTLFEGMPTVVLEAMMCGLPIVVSDTGATKELVDSQNGYLIEKNNVRSLKWGIQSFYQLNAIDRLKLSDASYKKVNELYTWPIVAKKHLDLFDSFKSKK
jgi:glycosyltransferase involved in cell wall biosynthesis